MSETKLDLWLDKTVGQCRFCDKPLGESPPPACVDCVKVENIRLTKPTNIKESDPYKKTWNTVADEEKSLKEWTKNGNLFTPNHGEIAQRHMSTARYLLNKARKLGRTAEGYTVLDEAMSHKNIAEKLLKQHRKVFKASR